MLRSIDELFVGLDDTIDADSGQALACDPIAKALVEATLRAVRRDTERVRAAGAR